MSAIVFEHCTLLDVQQGQMLPDRSIMVVGERIEEVSDSRIRRADARRIDVHGRTVMPGLCDAHVHVTQLDPNLQAMRHAAPSYVSAQASVVMRDMLVDLVGSLGYAADAASGGAEALALFDQNRYDIVLTDLLMPGMSGWEVLAAVRQRNPRIPVVIITGTAPTADDPRAAQAGVTVLRKPVDVKALDDTIKEKLTGRLTV